MRNILPLPVCAIIVTICYFAIPGIKDDWSFFLALIIFSPVFLMLWGSVEELLFVERRKRDLKGNLIGIFFGIIFITILLYVGPGLALFFLG